jgi:DNA ligase-1
MRMSRTFLGLAAAVALTAAIAAPAQAQTLGSDGLGVQLALPWAAGRDPSGFLVSEKFDGVRALWDGQRLRFRSGRTVAAPADWLKALPAAPLDGELWIGRGAFDRLSGVVRQAEPDDEAWRAVKYLVFDAPGHAAPFAQRVAFMQSTLAKAQQPWLMPVAQLEVNDARALQAHLQETVRQGCEGLMLHRAAAPWRAGRSADLLKLKPWTDAEGVVVAHLPGRGRHEGRLGALRVRLPDGRSFRLGTGFSDDERASPPPVGSRVSFRHQGRTDDGLPRFASFWRVRGDE